MTNSFLIHAIPPYIIHVGDGAFAELSVKKYSRAICCVDERVWQAHEQYIRDVIKDMTVVVIPSGEKSKSLDQYQVIIEYLLKNHIDRKGVVLAIGGGVVGDLAGFCAATYMRGIDFIQVPTTILAHDSAIGGKVAINTDVAKNSIGAFHQPATVYYDTHFLSTLPEREVLSGFGEICKHMFLDKHFYEFMQGFPDLETAVTNIETVLLHSMQVKQKFVEEDPYENDVRKNLNFGHTFGHALEQISGYTLSHGAAVAYGMAFAEYLATPIGVRELLVNYGLLTPLQMRVDFESVYQIMKNDKKNVNGAVQFVLIDVIGQPYAQIVGETELREAFDNWSLEYLV